MTALPPENEPPLHAVLLIDKPLGYTSMAICSKVRGMLRASGAPKRVKVGHGGTLDPLATGLLVVLVGRATRYCQQVMDSTKAYRACIDLSCISPTQDLESEPVMMPDLTPPSVEEIHLALSQFIGIIQQTPPEHSAMRIGGQRAYTLARAGKPVPVEPRSIRIDAIDLNDFAWPMLDITITCGKGTYIRSLARDIGATLGVGGMLRSLRRTRSGRFDVADAMSLGNIPRPLDRVALEHASVEMPHASS